MKQDTRAALEKATALLARREHARGELHRKLVTRGFSQHVADEALDALERENLLSDQRFAENFVRQCVAKGHGPVKIRHALRERGVGASLARRFIDDDRNAWRERAEAARIKRFGTEPPADMRERARQARFLTQRGFAPEHIRFAPEPP